jgi:hypothetical protein
VLLEVLNVVTGKRPIRTTDAYVGQAKRPYRVLSPEPPPVNYHLQTSFVQGLKVEIGESPVSCHQHNGFRRPVAQALGTPRSKAVRRQFSIRVQGIMHTGLGTVGPQGSLDQESR